MTKRYEYQKKYYLKNKEKLLRAMKEYRKGWYAKNKVREIAKKVAYHKANPHIVRSAKLKNRYGITLTDYDKMHIKQKGLCKICKEAKKLVVDHSHTTGAIRGLLCANCNVALGLINDNITTLKQMIKYLRI